MCVLHTLVPIEHNVETTNMDEVLIQSLFSVNLSFNLIAK